MKGLRQHGRQQWLIVVLAVCSMTVGARAQSGRKTNPRPSAESPIARIETREVLLPVSAYDAEGNNIRKGKTSLILRISLAKPLPLQQSAVARTSDSR